MIEKDLTISGTIMTNDGKTANSWFNSGERLVYESKRNQSNVCNLF